MRKFVLSDLCGGGHGGGEPGRIRAGDGQEAGGSGTGRDVT